MKFEYLPTEDDKTYKMYACFNEKTNEVIWNACSGASRNRVIGTEFSDMVVCRRGKIVVVEGCGWPFHFRFELAEDNPDKVVILAHILVGLMDQADEGELVPSFGG